MIKNYILIAFRNLRGNFLYSAINIVGLSLGITVCVFAIIFAQYENTHDLFFEKADRIYNIGYSVSPESEFNSLKVTELIHPALTPLLSVAAPSIEAITRLARKEFLLSTPNNIDAYSSKEKDSRKHVYQQIAFADKSFLQIFDFNYIDGNSSALDHPNGIILTETFARKLFPETSAMGKVISVDHSHMLKVVAVIRDIPQNSHFMSAVNEVPITAISSLETLNKIDGYKINNWDDLAYTYALLKPDIHTDVLLKQANAIYDQHAHNDTTKHFTGIVIRPLRNMNLVIWEVIGWPVMEVLVSFGLLVLTIASLNYTNLATAQAFGRTKEVGLRKTLGATKGQLLTQFLMESTLTAIIAMWLSFALLEIIIPSFNGITGKAIILNYGFLFPLLLAVTSFVGLIAGVYPAYIITQVPPIDALRKTHNEGKQKNRTRNLMITAQFVFSIFLLAFVSVVYFQNERLKNNSSVYPTSEIVTVSRLNTASLTPHLTTLKTRMKAIPGVKSVAYSSQVPSQLPTPFSVIKISGDTQENISLNWVSIDENFLQSYNIPLIAGRNFQSFAAKDKTLSGTPENVIINEKALKLLGFGSISSALNQSFSTTQKEGENTENFVIIGVVPDRIFRGFVLSTRPMVFKNMPSHHTTMSLRISDHDIPKTVAEIKAIWHETIPNFPIQLEFLDTLFANDQNIFDMIALIISGFVIMAFTLAFTGLFGLTAFMANQRTREIGIRKVLGAQNRQIMMLLVWQLSRPVLLAMLIAAPFSYFVSGIYLEIFADHIDAPIFPIIAAGLITTILAWSVVSVHAAKISQTNPIKALRNE